MVVQSTHIHDNESGKAPAVLMPLGAEGSLLMETSRRWSAGAIVTSILAVIGILVLLFWGTPGPVSTNPGNGAAAQLPKPSPKPSPKPDTTCSTSWKMVISSYENNKFISEGVQSIREAKNPSDAAKAAFDLSEKVRKDAPILKAFVKSLLHKDVEVGTLTDEKGCASVSAVQLTIEMDLELANAKSIVPDQAPSNGYNSGVNNGIVVNDTVSGIRGDRKAIKIVLADGTTIWVMARCGNIVTSGPPIFPPGNTDNPPPTVCPPGQHGTPPVCKDDPSKAPDTNTTAPIGGGKNVDPGPGAYVPPVQVQHPPSSPYVAPAAPVPATPQPQPTLDPAPAPSVEPSAAPAPVTSCFYAPGDTPC